MNSYSSVIKRIPFLFFVCIALIVYSIVNAPVTRAQISSCSASVTPSSVTKNTSQAFSFTIENTGDTPYAWIKITRPSANFTITGYSIAGWTGAYTSSDITFGGGELNDLDSLTLTVNATSGSTNASSANWTVQVSDDPGGASPYSCTGSLGVAISGEGVDSTPPTISNILVSNVASTSVTISWTTNESADSVIDYGLTEDDYSLNATSATMATTHSLTLTGLTANTTYYYFITGTDSSSNHGTSDFLTFVTAVSAAATSTPSPTATPTSAPGATITPTPTVDRVSPVVTISLDTSKPYREAPKITGNAMDDRGVASIEYSPNNGKTWRQVKDVTGLNTMSAKFSFVPQGLSDGSNTVKARAKDAAGNIGTSSVLTFVMDKTAPSVTLHADFSTPYKVSPQIKGTATDASGESSIDYSLDGGKNWLPADEIEVAHATITLFTFQPPPLDDGNYPFSVRARDSLGNVGIKTFPDLIIDRLPPRIGGMITTLGPFVLTPDADGTYLVPAGIEMKLTLSAVGGPTEVDVTVIPKEEDSEHAFVISLEKSADTGLWSKSFLVSNSGRYILVAHAIDGAKNTTEKEIGILEAIEPGSIRDTDAHPVRNARVTVYVFDSERQTFVPWDGAPFGQFNPQRTEESGHYYYFLPTGTYYLTVTAPGFRSLTTSIFTVKKEQPITTNLSLRPSFTLSIGSWKIRLPDWRQTSASIQPYANNRAPEGSSLIGKPLPEFVLQSGQTTVTSSTIIGKQTILTLLNTWFPQAAAQLTILEDITETGGITPLVVIPQETRSKVASYQRRGGYSIAMVADPDGIFVDLLPYLTIPQHIFINRNGTVTKVLYGLLSAKDLVDNSNRE